MPRSVTNTKTTAKKSGPFQRGYAAAKESAASSNSYGDTLFWFKVQGDKHRAVEEEVVFLHEYPTVVRMHNLTREINGKTVPQSILCTQDKSCVACDMGARVSSQSVFLILVPSTRDDSEFVVRRYMVSSKAIPQLERLSEKKGIAQKFTNIVRHGK